MHSSEFTYLAQDADQFSEVIEAFAPMNGNINQVAVLTHNPGQSDERWSVWTVERLTYSDRTFMQWDWQDRKTFAKYTNAKVELQRHI